MDNKKNKIRLGIFLFVTISLLIITIAILVGQKIFQKQKHYFIKYKDTSVRGLEVGSSVKYQGLKIGQVNDIIIDKDNLENIVVEISVRENIPIKSDVKAKLVYSGITGKKQLELSGGSDTTKVLPQGSYITPGESSLKNITGRAEVLANKTEHLINNLTVLTSDINQQKATNLLDNLESISGDLDLIISNNKEELQNIIINFEQISSNVNTISDTTVVAMNRLNEILNSEELDQTIQNFTIISEKLSQVDYQHMGEETQNLISNIDTTVQNINRTVNLLEITVLRSRQDLIQSLQSLEETSSNLRDFSREIKENPGALLRSRKRK